MKIIGLTGASGSGKSTISNMLMQKGICTINADLIAKQVMSPNSECINELAQIFGREIIRADGSLDRKKLSKIAFSNDSKKHLLNSITHPHITERINQILKSYEKLGKEFVMLDAPQLFESGIDKICDFTVGVIADRDLRVSRITQRDDIDYENAIMRLHAALDDEYIKQHTDYVIYNNDGIDQLSEKVDELYKTVFLGEINLEKN